MSPTSGRTNSTPVRQRHWVRNIQGAGSVETFLLVSISTILITRGYLELTDYPQVGGRTLHIAHALYGAAAMVIALVATWMFIGNRVARRATVIGGIGFGLFLDEVGKFVTVDNDYFYGPSAEIMYITVLALLVVTKILRNARPLTAHEYICNAARIAANGLAHGLTEKDKKAAIDMLDIAARQNTDDITVDALRRLILDAPRTENTFGKFSQSRTAMRLRRYLAARWIPMTVGCILATFAFLGIIVGIIQINLGGVKFEDDSGEITINQMGPASALLFASAALTFLIVVPSIAGMRQHDRKWPLIGLRLAALTFTGLNALAHFATEGFGGIVGIAFGALALFLLSQHIALHTKELPNPVLT
ncbi:hypothetical protein ACU5JM_00380 (plasmid) [Rhodococcus erythropolis]|uniref:hypothetical protein n=1 Tax=Rhodococcus erythropolis TaxID=1833 RepID=UPI00406BDA82